jgi:uncharacterized protein (DUF1697 family)
VPRRGIPGKSTAPRVRKDERAPGAAGAAVVVLRAVNVGGHGTVRTKEIPAKLSGLTAVNIGAAGTFVVRDAPSPPRLRKAFRAALGFDTDVIVRSGPEVLALRNATPESWSGDDADVRRYVTFLAADPVRRPRLPLALPDEATWEVRLDDEVGSDVRSSSRRRGDRRLLYPNEAVEREYGVPSTTRGWETLERIWNLLEVSP